MQGGLNCFHWFILCTITQLGLLYQTDWDPLRIFVVTNLVTLFLMTYLSDSLCCTYMVALPFYLMAQAIFFGAIHAGHCIKALEQFPGMSWFVQPITFIQRFLK